MPVPSPGTSASLLDQARDGRAGAWDRLVTLYTPLLEAWLTAAGLQAADRDDLTQRVLEVLVRQLPDFEHNGRPGAFGPGCALSRSIFCASSGGRVPEPEAGSRLEEISDPDAGLSRFWDEQHDRHVLHALMNLVRPEFTEATWQAFRRQALDGRRPASLPRSSGFRSTRYLSPNRACCRELRQEAAGLVD